MTDLHLFIVAENPLARMGLAALLADQPGITIAGQSAGGADLAAAIEACQPDVAIWDWGWENAADRLAVMREAGLPVVLLLRDSAQAAETRAAGALGLLFHDTDTEALVAALAAAAQGLVVLAPGLARALLPAAPQADAPAEALTPRELEVLQLLAEGLPNKTIAGRLGITDHTVKFHVNAIMSKLGAQSRTEAVVRATRLGFILL